MRGDARHEGDAKGDKTIRTRAKTILAPEPLEDRCLPSRTFVFLFTGFGAPAAGSGMRVLAGQIRRDLGPAAGVWTIGWSQSLLGKLPSLQFTRAADEVRRLLAPQHVTPSDRVVLVGHSYGGFIAYRLASDVPATDRPANALVTFDPIAWNAAGLPSPVLTRAVPPGVLPGNVLDFVQRNPNDQVSLPFLGSFSLKGFTMAGAINDRVLGRGRDDRWGTADDTTHQLIDDDLGQDGRTLGLFATVRSFVREVAGGRPSPVHAHGPQPAVLALSRLITRAFPFAPDADVYHCRDADPDSMPALYLSQGRGLTLKLSPSTQSVTRDELAGPVPRVVTLTGRVKGWGEGPLGDALFDALVAHAGPLGLERVYWDGRLWCAGDSAPRPFTGVYPRDQLFVGFSLDASQRADAALLDRVLRAARAGWDAAVRDHRGWPVVAVKPLGVYTDPFWIQPVVEPASDPSDPATLGRFSTRVYVGDEWTFDGTPFLVEVFPARDRAQADELFPEARTYWQLPETLADPVWLESRVVTRSNPDHPFPS